MPAQRDETAWKPTEGDHADDQSYERKHRKPGTQPTDEKRTEAEVGKGADKTADKK